MPPDQQPCPSCAAGTQNLRNAGTLDGLGAIGIGRALAQDALVFMEQSMAQARKGNATDD